MGPGQYTQTAPDPEPRELIGSSGQESGAGHTTGRLPGGRRPMSDGGSPNGCLGGLDVADGDLAAAAVRFRVERDLLAFDEVAHPSAL